ncbi:MAG: cysteine desulfurase family protein [Candidatus Altiarchaeota archaeon]
MDVYLDHAATTPVDGSVVKAMLPYMTERYGNASSLHKKGREARDALEAARKTIAGRINASPEEVIFTSGGSESDNLALKGVAYKRKEGGGHLITSRIEHPAVLETCRRLEVKGFNVTYLDVDGEGFISLADLEDSITEKTVMVSVMHANNEVGTINDIKAIGGLCHERGVLFHTDAVQSFTKTEIDVKKQNIDLASFSSHKIHGPKGVGALYVREDLKNRIERQIDGGGHEYRLRAGTENVAGAVGFSHATNLITKEDVRGMSGLRDKIIRELTKLPESHLNGPEGDKRLCNNANISFYNIEGESLLLMLDSLGVQVSTGSACSSASLEPSHVLTAMGRRPEQSHGSIRISLGRENTEEEVDYAIDAIGGVVLKLRALSPLV